MTKKTGKMQYLELKHGKPIDELIAHRLSLKGPKKTAASLGISQPTLFRWVKKLNLRIERVVVQEGISEETPAEVQGG